MANKFQIKRTSVSGRTPNTTSSGNSQYISAGELALNLTDQILYTSDGTNLITVGANVLNQSVTGTLTVNSISANGTLGSIGQVLTTNGTTVYWSNSSGGGGGTTVTVSDTAPSSPSPGNLWYYSVEGVLYIYYSDGDSSQWVTAAGSPPPADANNATYLNNQPASYYATAANPTLTGNVTISGNAVLNGIVANGSLGTAGQVLTSNGSNTYWSLPTSSAVYYLDDLSYNFDGINKSFVLTYNNGTQIAPISPYQLSIFIGNIPVLPNRSSLTDFQNLPEVSIFSSGFYISGNTINFATAPLRGMSFTGIYNSNPQQQTFTTNQTPFNALSIMLGA